MPSKFALTLKRYIPHCWGRPCVPGRGVRVCGVGFFQTGAIPREKGWGWAWAELELRCGVWGR